MVLRWPLRRSTPRSLWRGAVRLVDPRRRTIWLLLFVCGLAFRVYAVLVLRNPMDMLFSDPLRHWDNAEHFTTPSIQGASNPYLYQLYLFVVQRITHEDRTGIAVVTAALSVSYPLLWHRFARCVFFYRLNALRFATLLCWLPSHISFFGFFMNETLLLPLLGAALWFTCRTLRDRTPRSFVVAAVAWTLGVLTRSVVGPVGLACVAVSWWRLRRRRWLALAAAGAISLTFVAAASIRAHQFLKRYTPFGDNAVVAIYFVSGAASYTMDVADGTYWAFSSPSLFLSPFYPFYEFPSIREGDVSFTLDPERHGEDIQETLRRVAKQNRSKLPRLLYENFVFLSFGHSWPAAGATEDLADRICIKERWIWAPLVLISLIGCIVHIVRRGFSFVPMLTLGFIFTCYVLAQITIMEGRYRKPLEPIVLLAPIWLWDARCSQPPRKARVNRV